MKKILLSLFGLIAIAANAQTGNLLQNSSFEEWSDNLPNGWATIKATNATVEQSSDAHSGSSSVVVKGASGNKRFTSGSYTLEAGTYTISGYFKANGEEAGHYRLGYIKLKDGVVVDTQKDYIYDDTPAQTATSEWKEETFTFTLDAATEIAVNIMNNKNGKGASFLVDDVTLVAGESEGGEDGGEEPEQPTEVSTIAEVLAAGAGDAAVKGTVIATYARGFLVNDGTGTILVYLGSDKGHAEGDVVTVSGATSLYGGLLQFGAGSSVEKSGTASVSHPTPATMTGADLDAYLESPVIKYVEYTGTLNINNNYYNINVEGATTAIGSIQYPKEGIVNATSGAVVKVTGYTIGASSGKYVNTMAVKVEVIEEGEPEQPTEVSTIAEVLAAGAGDAAVKGTVIATYARGFLVNDGTGTILVYLGSDKGHAEGDVVTVSGATSLYGGLLQFGAGSSVEKSGTASVSHPTPATMTGADLDAYLESPVIKYVEYTGTLNINNNYYNINVEGATTAIGSIQYPKEGIVNATSGAVVKVTGYTIGASSGKYVNTMAVKVEVIEEGEPEQPTEVSTIAEVLAAGAGDAAVKGTIIATYARGFLVNDGTGTILVYLGSDKGYAEGDIVTVSGATNIYGGLLQFGTNPTVEKSGTTSVSHPTPTTMTGADLDAYLDSPVIKYVEYTGTLTINGNYYNVAVEGASTAIGSIQYPKEGVVTVQSGTVVKVTGYTIGASSGKYVNTMVVKVEAEEGDTQPDEPLVGSVSDALAAYVDGKQIQATVTGYIVGAVNGAVETGCEFGSTEVATNILIADNADESDYTKCLIIQLPKGDIRSALNLADNAENYKKQIKISGSLETYFKTAGLKSITEYEFTGVTGIESLENESGEKVIYDLTGRRVDTITKAGIYIVNGKKTLVK